MLTNQFAKAPSKEAPADGQSKNRISKIIAIVQLSLGGAIFAASAAGLITHFSKINSSETFEIVAACIVGVVTFAFLSTKFKILIDSPQQK